MDYKEIIAQQKAAFNAQKKIEDTEREEKTNILNGFIDQVFDFLELIQLDDSFTFGSYKRPLFHSYKFGPKDSIDWMRTYIKKEKRDALSIDYWLRFGINDNYIPFVKLTKELTDNDPVYYSVEDFARAITNICLQKRNK